MYVSHLTLHSFRSYDTLDVPLTSGVTAFLGSNGQGKTNIVEAVDYLSRMASHRVSSDLPLVRSGAERAIVRAAVVRDERRAVLEVEINPGKANRARVNRAPLPRARELIGLVRTVVFAPDDLALVKGDPGERRRFADDLLVLESPRYAGTRADYDRVLKQRNSLLRTARLRGGSAAEAMLATLEVWDERLARHGAEIMAARARLVDELNPLLGKAYEAVARGASRDDARVEYKPSFEVSGPGGGPFETGLDGPHQGPGGTGLDGPHQGPGGTGVDGPPQGPVAQALLDEIDRGVSLVGPHRDDVLCSLGDLPVKGYASHGEGWSFALAMRLASYELLRSTGDDPILVLDDVFAELDAGRRTQLAELVGGAEQVLVTAAVPEDVPETLRGRRFDVADGVVARHG